MHKTQVLTKLKTFPERKCVEMMQNLQVIIDMWKEAEDEEDEDENDEQEKKEKEKEEKINGQEDLDETHGSRQDLDETHGSRRGPPAH